MYLCEPTVIDDEEKTEETNQLFGGKVHVGYLGADIQFDQEKFLREEREKEKEKEKEKNFRKRKV